MTKLAVLFAVCLVVLFAAAAISAAPSITMDFVGEFRAGRPAIVRVTTTDIDLSNTVVIEPKAPSGPDEGKTYWDNSYIKCIEGGIVNDMNPDVLKQNNFLVVTTAIAGSSVVCVDEATRRPLVSLNYNYHNGSIMSFIAVNKAAHNINFPADKYGSFTFLCPMTIKTTNAYAPETTLMTATQSAQTPIDFTLAPPAAWSWREPLVTINSASYSANTGNLLGGKVKFQFSTDTAGIHGVKIRNGPQPTYYNRRTQEFTSYQCGDNVEAYIISGNGGLEIHVKDSAANGAPITCTVDVDGYMSSAFTERSQVVIAMDTVLVAQGIDFPVLDATFTVSGVAVDGSKLGLTMSASNLNFSASPLHTNSTVEIRFSGIDVNTIEPTSTEYRQDVVCSSLKGTFSQDGKSVFIKDISQVSSSFGCDFEFVGSKIVRLDEFTPVPTVQVLVDGVSLYNRAVRSTSFPLYLPLKTKLTQDTIQIYQDDSTIKHVVEFSLEDNQSFGVVPQKPILILSYGSPATWSTTSYGDVLSCEATSPSSSVYTPLVMTFDLERRTWTADLSSLIDTDAYKINFRCTRSEAVVEKFDIVQNTANTLNVSFLDVVSGKGYTYLSAPLSLQEQSPKAYLKKPTSPVVPADFTQYFELSGSVFITDFTTMTSVADGVSNKVLAVIKAGYDAYDATLPQTPAKLTPKLVNKAAIYFVADPTDPADQLSTQDYSPSFGQMVYNLFYTIFGHQFQQPGVKSAPAYGSVFSKTAHTQRSTPKINISQYFTSGSTYAEIQALSIDAREFADGEMGPAFYKDAYSTSPATPFIFSSSGFDFGSFSIDPVNQVMNPVDSCGHYQVGYSPTKDEDNLTYKFDYDGMTQNTQNQVTQRFTCAYAQACSSDADCDSGYCSKSTCAAVQPTLKYPYVKYDTVADFSEYDSYNTSVIASFSAVVVAVIVAVVM